MNSNSRRTVISVFLVFFAIIGILIYPIQSITTSATEDYRLWRQNDSRWANIKLGNSSDTMASSGCLVTSLAILAVRSGAKNIDNFNPGSFANSLNSVNAFSNGAIASWSKVTEVIPDVKFVEKYTFTSTTQSGKASEMSALYNKGYYLICNVGGHFVFIDSISGSTVSMIDPAKSNTDLFSTYKLANITELRVFTGKVPSQQSTVTASTTTKTTVATTVPTSPTTVAPTTVAPTSESYKLGEYYAGDYSYINIYSSSSNDSTILEYLYSGQLVKIIDINNGKGCIQLGAEYGWLDMSMLTYAGAPTTHKIGDINNDGLNDKLDLALLNDYLSSLSELPDGISILRECELKAADINEDGIVDNNDAIKYLELICE